MVAGSLSATVNGPEPANALEAGPFPQSPLSWSRGVWFRSVQDCSSRVEKQCQGLGLRVGSVDEGAATAVTHNLRIFLVLAFVIGAAAMVILNAHVPRPMDFCIRQAMNQADTSLPVDPRTAEIENLYSVGTKPWTDYFTNLDSKNLAPLTKEFQLWLYNHQNPPADQCRNRTFVRSLGHDGGLGSVLHVLGYHLSVAVEMNAILVLSPNPNMPARFFMDQGCDREYGVSWDCIFQPLSTCTNEDASNSVQVDEIKAAGGYNLRADGRLEPGYNSTGTFLGSAWVPKVWQTRLQHHLQRDLTYSFYKYWWRAQSATYLSRMNAESAREVRRLRMDPSMHHAWLPGATKPVPAPYPLPEGTVNMHVRHGDKAREMSLIPFQAYIDLADKVAKQNPLHSTRMIFVSSEDPDVIENATNLPRLPPVDWTTSDRRWTVYSSDIPRINSGPNEQLEKFGRRNMTLLWMLQLFMALECDTYYGTRGSNWNRLIDELRCVLVAKCHQSYYELGPEKDWQNYNW